MSTNAFKVMMKSSRKNDGTKPVAKRTKSESSGTAVATRNVGSNFWKKGLIEALKNPENVVESSDTLVVIKDKYPKVVTFG